MIKATRSLRKWISLVLTFLLAFIGIPFGVYPQVAKAAAQESFYVSPEGEDSNPGTEAKPFRTITKARDAVREVNNDMKGDICVYLRGGDYRITEPIKFGPEDSGTNGFQIYYKAYKGETPVLNGATKVTGWTEYKDGIYQAALNRSIKLRNLIVNDKPASMTTKTVTAQGGYGTYTVTAGQADWAWSSGSKSDGVKYKLTDIPDITENEDDIEIMNGTTWNENIVCVRDVDTIDGYRVLNLQQPYGAIAQTPGWGTSFSTSGSHKIYNVFEWLDEPGEFYFNKTTQILYYYPRSGEDIKTADVEAPVTEELLDIAGTSTVNRVKNLTFQGITFTNTDYSLVKVADSRGRATVQGATAFIAFGDGNWHNSKYEIVDTLQGMIEVSSSESIHFISNVIKHSGCDGITMTNDVVNCSIIGNYITDTSSSALTIGHPQHVYIGDGGTHEKYASGIEGVCKSITVKNNFFYDICTAPGFGGMNAITAFFGDTLKITYNTLMKTASSAVSLGWGWCNFLDSTTCLNNQLDNNRLIDNVNRVHDSGALYTLGQQPGTTVNENYVKGIPAATGGLPTYGLHIDEGSAYMTVNDNVLDISPNVKYTINCEDYGQKHDLTIKNTYATTYKMGVNPPKSDIDVPVVVPDNVWPLEQYNIALNSGVQEEYRSIIPDSLFSVSDIVFPASCSVDSETASIKIRSTGDATKTVWFAPEGTMNFAEGATMTKAAGDATSIAVPDTAGTYKLFILNDSDSIIGEAASILRVNATDGTEVTPQAEDFTDGSVGSQWTVKNADSANYSAATGAGLQITEQAGDISDDSIKNMFLQQGDGDWVAETKVTLSKAQDTNGQQTGLVIYGDSKNYIKLDYERVNGNSVYGLYNTLEGTTTTIGNTVTLNSKLTHYFRFVKSGTKYSAYYSTDGVTFNMLGSTASVIDPELGLINSNKNGTTAAGATATFEYIKIGSEADANADATLAAISVNGTPLSGFSSAILKYSVYVKDNDPVPVITASAVSVAAKVTIDNADNLQEVTTITVTNGFNKTVYTVSFGSTMKYEAEDATVSGGAKVASDHNNYSGTGFVGGLSGTTNSKLTFSVNVPSDGKYTLVLRYVNAKGATCNLMGLYVNGTKTGSNLSIPVTSNWDTWADLTQTVTLQSGTNTIAFNNETGGNAINIDYITLTKVLDLTAPTWTEGSLLSLTNLSDIGLTITWPVAQDDTAITGYKIYKGTDMVASVTADVHSFNVTGLTKNTAYTFRVEAGDAAGNWSINGPTLSVTTLGETKTDTLAPYWLPTRVVTASAITVDAITLVWSPAEDDTAVTQYKVYKDDNLVAATADTTISITGLSAETVYTFKVEAGDAAGNWSIDGPIASLRTLGNGGTDIPDTTAPVWPQESTVTGSAITAEALTLNWTPAQDDTGVTQYRVYKDNSMVAVTADTTISVTGLEAETSYNFRIEAGDAAGNWSTDGPSVIAVTKSKNNQNPNNGGSGTNNGNNSGTTITADKVTEFINEDGSTVKIVEQADGWKRTNIVKKSGEATISLESPEKQQFILNFKAGDVKEISLINQLNTKIQVTDIEALQKLVGENSIKVSVLGKEKLPGAATVTIPVTGTKAFQNSWKGTSSVVYVYYLDEKSGKLVEIPKSKRTISEQGTVSFEIAGIGDYILSNKIISGDNVIKLINTVKANTKVVTVKKGRTANYKITIPDTMRKVDNFMMASDITAIENVIVTYQSSNKKIATVSNKGTITGKTAGKVTITVTVEQENGVKKTFKKQVIIK